MRGKRVERWVAGLVLAASLGTGWAFPGCDDPNPTNCPPKPPCPPTCESANVGASFSTARHQRPPRSARERNTAWLLMTLRNIAGGIRAI